MERFAQRRRRRASIRIAISQRIGLANQTTMLMTESLRDWRDDPPGRDADRYGEHELADHYQAFDTICSATQDRQDAVVALLREHAVDLMIVIGGYNSSNTANLARICAASRPTFHIADPDCLVSPEEIRHRPVGSKTEVTATGLAARRRAGGRRPDVRRLDTRQPGRRGGRSAGNVLPLDRSADPGPSRKASTPAAPTPRRREPRCLKEQRRCHSKHRAFGATGRLRGAVGRKKLSFHKHLTIGCRIPSSNGISEVYA